MGVTHETSGHSEALVTWSGIAGDHDGVSMQQIADVVLDGTASSIVFSNIPQTYRDLELYVLGRSDNALALDGFLYLEFNGDAGANYDSQFVYGAGAIGAGAEYYAQIAAILGYVPAGLAAVGIGCATRMYVPAYARTDFQKAILSTSGRKIGTVSGNMYASATASFWRSTAAVTSLTIAVSPGSFVSGTVATLWGLG